MIIAIQRADGGVSIMNIEEGFDPDEQVAKWQTTSKVAAVSHFEIDEADIPTERTFRDAWTLNGDKIEHDLDRAKAIHAARFRDRDGAVPADKQAAIDAAQSIDDLKAIEPATRGRG